MYLPVEGFLQFAEFWETMGQTHPWKPAVYVVVTVPVAQPTFVSGGIVTTAQADVILAGGGGARETLTAIGGEVQDSLGPVAGAWVRVELPPVFPATVGEAVGTGSTDELGRFVFDRLSGDSFVIRVRAAGLGETILAVSVPSPTGATLVQFP